jgi:hypothetical protein
LAVTVLVIGPEWFAFLSAERVIVAFSDSREAQDLPFRSLQALQTAHEIVFVERRGDQDDGSVGRQARQQVVGEPGPRMFAARL